MASIQRQQTTSGGSVAGLLNAPSLGRHASDAWCDYERLPATLAGLHLVVFACVMLHHWMAFSAPPG